MPDDLEQTIFFTCMTMKELLEICPERLIAVLINHYPDVLEAIEAEIANKQVQDFLAEIE